MNRPSAESGAPRSLQIRADSQPLHANPFIAALIINVLVGFASSLKGVPPDQPLRFERRAGGCRLLVGQREVPLNQFLETILSDLLQALIGQLHTAASAKSLEVYIGAGADSGPGIATSAEEKT